MLTVLRQQSFEDRSGLFWLVDGGTIRFFYLNSWRFFYPQAQHVCVKNRSAFAIRGLTMRRVTSDLIQTLKIIKGMDKVDKGLFFEFDSGGRRGHSDTFLRNV